MSLESEFYFVAMERQASEEKAKASLKGFFLIVGISLLAWIAIPVLTFSVGYNIGQRVSVDCKFTQPAK